MSNPARLEIYEITLATGGLIRVPAATAEQAAVFTPPAGLRWHPLELANPPASVRVLVQDIPLDTPEAK